MLRCVEVCHGPSFTPRQELALPVYLFKVLCNRGLDESHPPVLNPNSLGGKSLAAWIASASLLLTLLEHIPGRGKHT